MLVFRGCSPWIFQDPQEISFQFGGGEGLVSKNMENGSGVEGKEVTKLFMSSLDAVL